jgi:hypothetical protein
MIARQEINIGQTYMAPKKLLRMNTAVDMKEVLVYQDTVIKTIVKDAGSLQTMAKMFNDMRRGSHVLSACLRIGCSFKKGPSRDMFPNIF